MGKSLVFVGAGHAHLTCLKNLSAFRKLGLEVTVVSSFHYHYYSGMGPGMLSGIYRPQEVRFHVKKMTEDRDATFISAKVVKVDPRHRLLMLDSGRNVSYDIVSFNTGSEVAAHRLAAGQSDNLFPVKPVINLLKARGAILDRIRDRKKLRIGVIGGGPGGIEVSANLLTLLHDNQGEGEITLIGGKRLLSEAPDKVRRLAMDSLVSRGARIVEGSHVKAIQNGQLILNDGKRIDTDLVFIATGIEPSPLFRDSGIPVGTDGGLLVNANLQSVAHPDIFGGGDCISLEWNPLAKVGVYAVRQNPVLYHNLLAVLKGEKIETFKPQRDFLLILNMGNGKGIFWKQKWIWEGRLAFLLKDYIDRKFMRSFQVSGELSEPSGSIE
jgi:NADH dehydrogenase FAD-containing subunit